MLILHLHSMAIAVEVQKNIVSSLTWNLASSGFAPVPEVCNGPQLRGYGVSW